MDRTHAPGATTDHKYTEGNPSLGVPATTVGAVALNAFQEELIGIIEAAGITPSEADNDQVLAALHVLFASAASTVTVSDFAGVADLISGATETDPQPSMSQYRATVHRKANGAPAYVDLDFRWSRTYTGAGSTGGWRIPALVGTLGAAVDTFLRTVWGIGPSAEWTFPYLHGTIWQGGVSYPFAVYHQAASKYAITGSGFDVSSPSTSGRISLRIPVA